MLLGIGMLFSFAAFAQDLKISAKLADEASGDPLGFATVSLLRDGNQKPVKYVLADGNGKFELAQLRKGQYTVKIELMGYVTYSKAVKLDAQSVDLGTIKLKVDAELLEEASVSAVGNPIVVKKDTIEYNASSFRTTESDVLEDLLKKLPGVEVTDDGTITVNGESVSKITVGGKTFFLNDPELASKNIPARLVQKLKVIKKKSEQAEFTGIDDGQEETVIDLSVQPGMMKGLVGNVTAGGGMDVKSGTDVKNEFRYQGNAMLGRFNEGSNISLILNANNNNGGGAGDRSGNMMRGMMGGMGGFGGFGGGRSGITSSYMAGLNGAFDLLDDKMDLGGNYVLNGSKNDSRSDGYTRTNWNDYYNIENFNNVNISNSIGHRFGLRLEHEFSKNTSILFQPEVNFGSGNYSQKSYKTTDYEYNDGEVRRINESNSLNTGNNKNVSTGGFFLFRQRILIPGRTITANVNYNFSNNQLNGVNDNDVEDADKVVISRTLQNFESNQKNASVNTNITYTEPLGDSFYLQANYGFNWSRQSSEKLTYDMLKEGHPIDHNYSNNIVNLNRRHEIGVDALYQSKKVHAQVGFAALPEYTYNSTTQNNTPRTYEDNRWNFSPRVMFFMDASEKVSARFFYRGNSSQPSTSQLMPVPDNSNPLSVSFGNPNLKPYFSHNINGDIRFSDREKFTSFNMRLNGGIVQNPIVNTSWRSSNIQYALPFNGKNTANAGVNFFFNIPFGKSAFSINNTLGSNWRRNTAYQGYNIDMSTYDKEGFYAFMNEFVEKFGEKAFYDAHIVENTTNSLNVNERLRFTYRGKALEANLGGSTRMSKAWYHMSQTMDGVNERKNTLTWNNTVSFDLTWNWALPDMTFKVDYDYRWYNGYETSQPSQNILNLRISKNIKSFSIELRGYDLFDQSRNINVSNESNYYSESTGNALGRYVILAVSYRFGSMNRRGGMMRGPGGPGMGGPGPGMGGGRRP